MGSQTVAIVLGVLAAIIFAIGAAALTNIALKNRNDDPRVMVWHEYLARSQETDVRKEGSDRL